MVGIMTAYQKKLMAFKNFHVIRREVKKVNGKEIEDSDIRLITAFHHGMKNMSR